MRLPGYTTAAKHNIDIHELRQKLWSNTTFFLTHYNNTQQTSLVPRPSHHPDFDHLQYAKGGGGRPGPFYHVNDGGVPN